MLCTIVLDTAVTVFGVLRLLLSFNRRFLLSSKLYPLDIHPSLGRTRGKAAHSVCALLMLRALPGTGAQPPTWSSYAASPAVTDRLPGEM
jgi:hypothetical protein